jgi:hypothetical protein
MTKKFKQRVIRTLAIVALAAGAASSADAAIWVRSRLVVTPIIAAPVIVAPVTVPVVAAPVVVAPVCSVVSVPVVHAFTGLTYLVPRRVCN